MYHLSSNRERENLLSSPSWNNDTFASSTVGVRKCNFKYFSLGRIPPIICGVCWHWNINTYTLNLHEQRPKFFIDMHLLRKAKISSWNLVLLHPLGLSPCGALQGSYFGQSVLSVKGGNIWNRYDCSTFNTFKKQLQVGLKYKQQSTHSGRGHAKQPHEPADVNIVCQGWMYIAFWLFQWFHYNILSIYLPPLPV